MTTRDENNEPEDDADEGGAQLLPEVYGGRLAVGDHPASHLDLPLRPKERTLSFTLAADDDDSPRSDTSADDVMEDATLSTRRLFREARQALLTALSRQPKELAPAVTRAWSAEWEPKLADVFAAAGLAATLSGMASLAGLLLPDEAGPSERPAPSWLDSEDGARDLPLVRSAAERLASMGLLSLPRFLAAKERSQAAGHVAASGQTDLIASRVRAALMGAAEQGRTLEQFRRDVEGSLGGTALSPADAETIFRTNVVAAYSDGQEALLAEPEVGGLFPFRAYHATHDDRTRPEHLAMETAGIEGTNLYLADDPVWQLWRPPSGHNCRCTWTAVTVAEAARRGIAYAQDWKKFNRKPPSPPYVAMPRWRPDAEFAAARGVTLSAAEDDSDSDVADLVMRLVEGMPNERG